MNDQTLFRPADGNGPLLTHLEGLNHPQRQAVETVDGPLLVLAGAGTGKTRVLTTRISHILLTQRASPNQILAVTFTNKAAREMRDRVARMIGRATEGLWIGTFHAIATRILRRHAEVVGLKSNFTILDQDDQIRLVKQIIEAEDIDDKRWSARAVHAVIERFKDRGLTPAKISVAEAGDIVDGRIGELYKIYQDRLVILNAADFGDLLLHCLTIFTSQPDVLKEFQRQFRYVLVDEYQDSNVSQYLWLRLLAQARSNICCVGDDDQSIYSWRGAEVGNILRFERDFPGAEVIRLEQNYRSTQQILSAASQLIAVNEGRLGKNLWTELEDGEPIRINAVWDGESEARLVGDEIEHLQRAQESLNEIAILVRASFQMREFEERLITLGLPYRVVGGPRFYERAEIRDAIAYLRVVVQPDDDLALERIINTPRRGLGTATLQTMHGHARALGISLHKSAIQLIETDELKPQTRSSLRRIIGDLARWRAQVQAIDHIELAKTVLDESGYTSMWKASKAVDAPGRLENLKELVSALNEFDSLGGFLEHISLVMDREDNAIGEMVSIMTLHAAKGLEFNNVFLPGWEEEVFPNRRSVEDGGGAALEEERRLAYVGLTRARRRVWISHASTRRVYNQWLACAPSRFIDELPEDLVDHKMEAGLYEGIAEPDLYVTEEKWSKNAGRRGPGFQRMRVNKGSTVLMPKEGEASTVSAIVIGIRVFHQKFGYGMVVSKDGSKLEIDFEKAGTKKVLESFVEPV
ncbi:MAG: DNA helicase II [Alphaproteobacteria bacterium MarineAlpha11_Bin1]|nr:MAG: DNA helicase II [Alphaproteobacteria bacterium MarineAlpha11_Bin1]